MENLLDYNLIRFVSLLRRMGLRAGTGEVLDAFQALALVPPEDKEAVQVALRSTLAKKEEEQAVFDRCFELYFSPPEIKENRKKDWRWRQEAEQEGMEQADADLRFQGESLNLSQEEKRVYSHLPPEHQQRMKDYLKQAEQGEKDHHNHKPMLETIVKSSLSYWHRQMEEELQRTRETGDEELDAIAGAVEGGKGKGQFSVIYEDMQQIAESDLPQAVAVIRQMARRLVKNISRRYQSSRRRRKLDLRRTIRENISYGGTLFRLKYRSRRVTRPRLLLLCDVSGSMARYSTFVIQFIYGINSVLGQIETFLFANNLERVSPALQSGVDFSGTMMDIVNTSREWGGGTSLSQSLQTLRENYSECFSSKTIVVIVSDTRTINLPRAEEELQRLRRRVKDIIWLNTLPQERWQNSRSVEIFSRHARMFPCNTLADLEQVAKKGLLG